MAISMYAAQLLLHFLTQQRTVYNYLLNIEISQQLKDDINNFASIRPLIYTIAQNINQVYIADDPAPECCTGKWLYQYRLMHQQYPTYQVIVIAQQRINKCSGFVGILDIIAMQFE